MKKDEKVVDTVEEVIDGQIDIDGHEAKGKNGVQEVEVEVKKKKRGRPKKQVEKKEVIEASEAENELALDLDAILGGKRVEKKPISFNQDKSISDKLNESSSAANLKPSETLNKILRAIVNVEDKKCMIDIDEKKEERVQNTFKVDSDVLEVLKAEAKKRNMSLNDYLNKILTIALNIK